MRKLLFFLRYSIIIFFTVPLVLLGEDMFDGRSEALLGLSEQEVINFLAELQSATRADDPNKLADLVWFPYPRYKNGVLVATFDREEFIAAYRRIWTKPVQKAVLEQRPEDLFINYQGVMIGRGEVWFSSVYPEDTPLEGSLPIYIIAINY